MLGCSPYMTRTQLLHKLHTGLTQEHDAATEQRFADGHRFEALARPVAEEIIGTDLYPCTGTEGELSASFDGLSMDESVAFEHKTLSAELRVCFDDMLTVSPQYRDEACGRFLPKHYRVQMQQQCMVARCKRVLFMASMWGGDTLVEERHCWYTHDAVLEQDIALGWSQFAIDLAAYVPPAAAAVVVATPVQALPAVTVLVTGEISIKDNFAAFEVALRDFLEHRLIRFPKTDQDFADLDVQIKAMKGAEAALDGAESQMLAQIVAVDTAVKTKAMLRKLVADNRLMAEKLMASEKERRRGEIVAGGIVALREHVAGLNQRLGQQFMPPIQADFAMAIKGMRSLSSMEDAVATLLANSKIAANETADRIQINMQVLLTAGDNASFPDAATLVLKATDDCRAVVAQRITETERKLDDLRERIRAEEQAKAEKDARDKLAAEQSERDLQARRDAEAAKPAPTPAPAQIAAPAVSSIAPAANVRPLRSESTATIRLGQINERLAPIQLTADGLATLGFQPVAVEKAAKLYTEASFDRICGALIAHIEAVRQPMAA